MSRYCSISHWIYSAAELKYNNEKWTVRSFPPIQFSLITFSPDCMLIIFTSFQLWCLPSPPCSLARDHHFTSIFILPRTIFLLAVIRHSLTIAYFFIIAFFLRFLFSHLPYRLLSSIHYLIFIKCCDCFGVQCCCILYVVEHWIQTLMVQVARRSASVLKRRKSRNRMEVPSADRNHEGPSPSTGSVNDVQPHTPHTVETQMSKDSESEVIYYMDEPQPAGKRNQNAVQRLEREKIFFWQLVESFNHLKIPSRYFLISYVTPYEWFVLKTSWDFFSIKKWPRVAHFFTTHVEFAWEEIDMTRFS